MRSISPLPILSRTIAHRHRLPRRSWWCRTRTEFAGLAPERGAAAAQRPAAACGSRSCAPGIGSSGCSWLTPASASPANAAARRIAAAHDPCVEFSVRRRTAGHRLAGRAASAARHGHRDGSVDAALCARGRGLQAVSPLATLDRGFAIVTAGHEGRIITDSRALELGDDIEARSGARPATRENHRCQTS